MARTRGLSQVSVVDLQAELGRRQKSLKSLMKRHDKLVAELEGVRAEIEGIGASVGGGRGRGRGRVVAMAVGGRRRPKNESNLVDALATVLDGKTMSVTEVAQAVQEAGYKTTSASFRTIVNQTLINSGKFKRVGRGQYTLK